MFPLSLLTVEVLLLKLESSLLQLLLKRFWVFLGTKWAWNDWLKTPHVMMLLVPAPNMFPNPVFLFFWSLMAIELFSTTLRVRIGQLRAIKIRTSTIFKQSSAFYGNGPETRDFFRRINEKIMKLSECNLSSLMAAPFAHLSCWLSTSFVCQEWVCVNLSNVSNAYDQDRFIRVVSVGDVSIGNLSVVHVLIEKLSWETI